MSKRNGWFIQQIGERVDSFNHAAFSADLEKLIQAGELRIALDLRQTKFLSIPGIQIFGLWADKLIALGGQCALIGLSEKLRRQMLIFSSLDRVILAKSPEHLSKDPSADGSPVLDGSPGF